MENFDSSISNGDKGKWIVFFGSPWCSHCQVFAPVYKKFAIKASMKKNGVNYGAVNCELNGDVCNSQKVKMYPTVFFYSEGYKYALNGKRTEEALLSFIERYNVDNKKYPIALANKDAKAKIVVPKVNDQDKKSENKSTKTIATSETKSSKASTPKTADKSEASTPKTADTSKAPKTKTADTSKALIPKTADSSKAPTPKSDDTKTRLAQKETVVVAGFNKTHYFMMFFVLFLVVFIVYLVILPMLKKWIFRTSADDIAEQVQDVKCFEGFGSSNNHEEDTEDTIAGEI